MDNDAIETWSAEQRRRLDEFKAPRCVDIHCHCLPGFDDGPGTVDEAIALCEALVKDGITTAIATPHQLGRYDRTNSTERVRESVEELTAELKDREIPLEVFPGGDVRVDERLPELVQMGKIGTAADAGRHILLELPHDIFVDALPTIDELRKQGVQTILTHPERHLYLRQHAAWVQECVRHGAVLQITAGSILGEFGQRAHEQAWQLLRSGLVAIVASDAHDVVRRPPRMSEAIALLGSKIGYTATRVLAIQNPVRVFNGELITG